MWKNKSWKLLEENTVSYISYLGKGYNLFKQVCSIQPYENSKFLSMKKSKLKRKYKQRTERTKTLTHNLLTVTVWNV